MRFCNIDIKFSKFIPSVILNAIYKRLIKETFISNKLNSYSQYNEDMVVDLILNCNKTGFYVDIGANHPTIFNNTKRFYDRGWRGINIEPNPSLFTELQMDRPGDINLNLGVGDEQETLPFYVMSANTLSSFDKYSALKGGKIHGAKLDKIISVDVLPLKQILEKYAPAEIDILSVDTEGYDLRVIKSNDWFKWRPKVIIVETAYDDDSVNRYLADNSYEMVYDNNINSIYVDISYLVQNH